MFQVLLMLMLLHASLNAPTSSPVPTIEEYESVNNGTGPYKFKFRSSDGISRDETAILRNQGTDRETLYIHGKYIYPVGQDRRIVEYEADADGFRILDVVLAPPSRTKIASAAIASLVGGGLG